MEHNAFLSAIIDNPDDDGRRLVYADWLDERGDARGEFIRVQIEISKLKSDNARWHVLKERERSLEAENRAAWLQPLPKAARYDCRPRFRRGFVSELSCTVTQFLKVAAGVCRVTPLQGAWLLCHSANREQAMSALAQCRHLIRLSELNMSHAQLGDPGIAALAASPHLDNLACLILRANRVADAGAQALARSLGLGNLRKLDLAQNAIGETGQQALCARFGNRVHF